MATYAADRSADVLLRGMGGAGARFISLSVRVSQSLLVFSQQRRCLSDTQYRGTPLPSAAVRRAVLQNSGSAPVPKPAQSPVGSLPADSKRVSPPTRRSPRVSEGAQPWPCASASRPGPSASDCSPRSPPDVAASGRQSFEGSQAVCLRCPGCDTLVVVAAPGRSSPHAGCSQEAPHNAILMK